MSFGLTLVPVLVYLGKRLRCAVAGHELDPDPTGVTHKPRGPRSEFRCTRCGGRSYFIYRRNGSLATDRNGGRR